MKMGNNLLEFCHNLNCWRRLTGFIVLMLLSGTMAREDRIIYHIAIEGTIDVGLVPYVKRVINEAENQQAGAILVEINTLGGRLDAMIEIRDAFFDSKVRVIGYVNKRAISAGALIALACPELYMAPGATIGAATPVNQTGGRASEKVVSYARTEFKATAERNKRPVDIAVAMVDEDMEIDSLIEKGKLLTLTASEAVTYKVADGQFSNLDELLEHLDLTTAKLKMPETNWAENIIRVINHPIVSGILLTVGMLGLITEVTTAGWGIPGTIGLIALVLYFATHFMVGLAGVQELLMILAGVILILLEVLIIPGFGIAGILGIVCLVVGIILSKLGKYLTASEVSAAIWITIGSLTAAVFWAVVLIKFMQRRPFWAQISLSTQETKEIGFASSDRKPERIGMVGTALTDLRPSGMAVFQGRRLDVVTQGEYIEAGTKVSIIRDEGYRLIVEKVDNPNAHLLADNKS